LKQLAVFIMTTPSRPLSPHLQVYRWQLTMFLSILHRATGFGLALGALLLCWWLTAAMLGADSFQQFHDFTGSLIGKVMLAGWLYALVFHFMNGIRHLVWDTGRWLTLGGAYASGYFVFFGSILGTAAIWFMAGA
jgi:succinate dehydrogenase / fumarate reductase cytochrome b subunit